MTEAKPAGDHLTFAALRAVNMARCVEGFGHSLASWSVAEWTNAMAGETGEACNLAKKMIRHRDSVAGNKGDDRDLSILRSKLAREVADAVIYADLVAASQGFDLGAIVVETINAKSAEIGAVQRLPAPEPACGGCGGPHQFDTSIPSVVWNEVIRAKGLSEYLCTTCIVREFVRAGRSFTATLYGDGFSGEAIEVRIGVPRGSNDEQAGG